VNSQKNVDTKCPAMQYNNVETHRFQQYLCDSMRTSITLSCKSKGHFKLLSRLVTWCTKRFNIQQLYALPTLC